MTATQLFAPYGGVRYSQGTMPTTYNFTGQRLDSETGLLCYNFRYYDPLSGRFARADTVQNNAGGKDSYAYVANNPETKDDPTGHKDCTGCYQYWHKSNGPLPLVDYLALAAPLGLLLLFGLGGLAITAVTTAVVADTAVAGVVDATGTGVADASATASADTVASGTADVSSGVSSDISSDGPSSVTYSRVQGGNPPNASRFRIFANDDGSISIPDKSANLNVSVGDTHAEYFQGVRGGDAKIVQFDVPKWFDDFVNENAVDQYGYRSNPLNQGGTVPKLVDPTTPGTSYEFPPPWIRWIEEYATNGRVI